MLTKDFLKDVVKWYIIEVQRLNESLVLTLRRKDISHCETPRSVEFIDQVIYVKTFLALIR